MKIKHLQQENGAALIITLTLMALLFMVAISSVDRSDTNVDLSFNQVHEEQSFYIAEAGAKKAFYALNDSSTWRNGYSNETYGTGTYDVVLIDSMTDTTLFDTVIIVATGYHNEAQATVEIETVPEYKHPFQQAMFADAGISLDRNTCTDSFNSDSGSYASTVLDSLGSIGSNGTITSAKDVNFGGDVSVATAGGITLGVNNTVNGDTTSIADSVDLDIIPSSEYTWAESVSPAPLGLSGSNFSYNSSTKNLTMGSSGILTLQSGTYYFNDITCGQDSQILLAPGADVTLYINGDIVLNQNSTVNDGGNPADLIVYSRGSNLQFDQGNTFYGAFYGPNAHIQYDQTTNVYGALVGNSIKLDKGACFHYDRNLGNLTKGTTGVMLFSSWGEDY
ncbi:MAG: hypothetical protein DWP97_07440 [Calditrichaeota bacterium]|nr:MAG: hypothetical protein DWP97_07440 [Calditrichota bacterium]